MDGAVQNPQDRAVSVVMSVYNAERYVAEATESILNQTFEDFEFIIIDDGSTDKSLKILERYAKQDDRIRLISRANRGLAASLNEGIELARAPLIARMDADDVSLPERLDKQVAYMAHHTECVALGTGKEVIDGKGRLLTRNPSEHCCHDAITDGLMRGKCWMIHPSTMLRKDMVRRIYGYRPEFRVAQDYDLWLRLSEVGELANLPEPLIRYREHSQSVSTRHAVEQLELARHAFEEACKRRGIAGTFELTLYREGGRTRSEARTWSYGHCRGIWLLTLEAGRWSTAFVYAWKCVAIKPWRPGAWWHVAKTLVVWGRHAVRNRFSASSSISGTLMSDEPTEKAK